MYKNPIDGGGRGYWWWWWFSFANTNEGISRRKKRRTKYIANGHPVAKIKKYHQVGLSKIISIIISTYQQPTARSYCVYTNDGNLRASTFHHDRCWPVLQVTVGCCCSFYPNSSTVVNTRHFKVFQTCWRAFSCCLQPVISPLCTGNTVL